MRRGCPYRCAQMRPLGAKIAGARGLPVAKAGLCCYLRCNAGLPASFWGAAGSAIWPLAGCSSGVKFGYKFRARFLNSR